MRFRWTVRKPFRRLPDFAWLVLIDSLDFFSALADAVATALGYGVGGTATNTIFDGVQSLLVFAVFEEPILVVANADFILPQGFDLLPSYIGLYVADRMGLLG